MTLAMEIRRQRAEAREEALAEGMEKGKMAAALEMLKDHVPAEMVAKYTQLSVDAIKKLAKQNQLI